MLTSTPTKAISVGRTGGKVLRGKTMNRPIEISDYYEHHIRPEQRKGPQVLFLAFLFAALFGVGIGWIIASGLR